MSAPSRLAVIVRGALLLLAGAGLATLLILNPFGLPLPWRTGGSAAPASTTAAASAKQLWTCGMHPQVIQDHPGTCPICHMDLTPLAPEAGPAPQQAADPAMKQLWTCGMHPQVMQDHAGTCPICHMDLTPLQVSPQGSSTHQGRKVLFWQDPSDLMKISPTPAKNAAGVDYEPVFDETTPADSGPEVVIDPGLIQRMNVTTVVAKRTDLSRTVSTVGIVEFDHELETTVTVKFRGYVEHVHVHLVGQQVRRGQALFDVYSPELVQTQRDLLSALQYARRIEDSSATSEDTRRRARDLVAASRERLRLWDISPAQIARVEKTGDVTRVMTISAPATGVITQQLDGLAGMEVSPGMSIYTITDISRAWVTAEIYEDQIAIVRGQEKAWVRLDAFPGERFPARVRAIKPWVERESRTVSITLALDNPGGRFKQGMYAHVEFEPVVATAALLVPNQAILRTGVRNVAIVAKGEGRFAPREVVLGQESGGQVEILSGLNEGEEVVTSAQFLIDSESSLKAAIQAMIAHEGH